MIIGSVALSTIFSTIIVAKIGFQSPEKIVPIAATKPPYQPPAPQPQRNFSVPEVKQAPVQPQIQRPAPVQKWIEQPTAKIYQSEKSSQEKSAEEQLLNYKVFMKEGWILTCNDVKRISYGIFKLTCENMNAEVHISKIKDMERRTAMVPNGIRVVVIKPEEFSF